MITHVFDSSAILAHYLQENGASDVNAILTENPGIGISALSLIELKTKFDSICPDPSEAERAFRLYADEVAIVLPVDREIARLAIELRESCQPGLPLVDAVMAATAKAANAFLVHRDKHFAGIPAAELKQIVLPEK